MGGNIDKLFIWYQVTRKHCKKKERKKSWWQYAKCYPPSYEKWTNKDENNLQHFKSADIYLDDTAYGQYKTNLKLDVLNSIYHIS